MDSSQIVGRPLIRQASKEKRTRPFDIRQAFHSIPEDDAIPPGPVIEKKEDPLVLQPAGNEIQIGFPESGVEKYEVPPGMQALGVWYD